MTVKSLRKQLAAAIAMTLVATVALGSSTYAWFAINSKVTATGMNFTTKVSDNLFITTSEQSLAQTTIADDALFGTALVANKSAVLEPVSTTDGNTYYYSSVTNVLGSGDTKRDEWIKYNHNDSTAVDGYANAFSKNYGVTGDGAKGYLEYIYNLKAINGGSANLELALTKLDLSYAQEDDAQKAVRVAVMVEKANETTVTDDTTEVTTNYKKYVSENDNGTSSVTTASIFTKSGAENFTQVSTVNQAVKDKDGSNDGELGNVTYNAPVSIQVAAGKTEYYKVVVRMWLEGEDKSCNNTTFANLDGVENAWALNLEWQLGADADVTPASNITEIDMGSITVANNTNHSEKAFTINGYDYYKVDGVTISVNGSDAQLYIAVTKDTTPAETIDDTFRFYTIDQSLYPMDVTNRVIVTTP